VFIRVFRGRPDLEQNKVLFLATRNATFVSFVTFCTSVTPRFLATCDLLSRSPATAGQRRTHFTIGQSRHGDAFEIHNFHTMLYSFKCMPPSRTHSRLRSRSSDGAKARRATVPPPRDEGRFTSPTSDPPKDGFASPSSLPARKAYRPEGSALPLGCMPYWQEAEPEA
jgi:hypothetical protein